MKKVFQTRLEATDWIAARAENEGQFEAMREQVLFNFIYFGEYFIDTDSILEDVVMLDDDDKGDRRL
jgi:hypothetical protein